MCSAAYSASLVLGYGGTTTSNGVGVYPQNASANSERYFRCIVGLSSTETLISLRLSGVRGNTLFGVPTGTQLFPKPNGNWGDPRDGVTRYVISSGTTTYTAYTIGPFAGYDIWGNPHAPNNVVGWVSGRFGEDTEFRFTAQVFDGTNVNTLTAVGYYRTNADNADILEWFSGDAFGIDPLSVVDSPTPGVDNGSSSNTYRFRVQYKIPAIYALNLLPRFGTDSAPPGPEANFADFDRGAANATIAWDRSYDWWTYDPGGSVSTTPADQSPTYPREDDFTDLNGYYQSYVIPEVVLIIDGDRSRPHYMQREDPNDNNARDANGIRYFYELLPTDYMNFMDHIFLFPYANPGPDPQDGAATHVRGRPVSNNYVAFQVGGHTYEFICSDDFSPPDQNRVWLQVGQPGNGEYNDYMQPIYGSGGQMQSTRVNTRFSDADGAAGGYGYPYDSQDPNQYPNVNPMLTAHPYFPRGCIQPYASDANMTVNPPGAAANPFAPEVGFGPNPPERVTNDDTILPNFVNIRPDTDPQAPFRGGKWTVASSYTFRINYWQSNNVPPKYIRVMIRKNNRGSTPGLWQGYTMEKANPADNNFTDGCVYQYVTTPDQLPGGGGPGDYNYYFVASDGTREAIFPNRPARYTYTWIDDPADIGVPVDPNGHNDYYTFRVNRPPSLSNQSVTPTVGRTGDNFRFKVTYTDPDGEFLNASATGDRPFEMSIFVDLFGNPKGECRVVSVTSNTTLNYSTSTGTGYAANELVGKAVEILTGPAAGKRYRITSNTATQIALDPAPPTADPPYNNAQLVTDGVASGARFRIAEWFHGTMKPENDSDLNYADGKNYVFDSAEHVVLSAGVHRYYFRFTDDWGSWVYPNDANVRVEGETVRYPFTGEFEGPEVQQNTPPILTDFRFTPDALTGPDGTTATAFVFSVTYRDEENNPPTLIRLGIDGTADAPAIVLNMFPDNPEDTVYTDGAIYKTPPVKLAEGQHIFRAQASDGAGRFPPSAPSDPFRFSGPPDPNDPSTLLDFVDGPFVAANTPPRLTFPASDSGTDPNNPPGLEPNTGQRTTEFTYTIIYTDVDRFAGVAGNPPDYVRVVIDGVEYDMTKVDPNDNDYTDGATYQFKISGLVEGTPHRYWFVASDGLDRARKPAVGATPNYYNGPIVDEPPGPPQSLLAQDRPNDNGGVIDLTFNASRDDGGGAGDVREYRVYRSTTAGAYSEPPILTIPATGAPTYAVADTTAVTGTSYYYVVRAWDGANESPNSNEEGPVSALDNIPPLPPSNVSATDPGQGGTLQVSWNLSPDDGGGQNDVKEYHIYRATTPTGFTTPVATVTKGTGSYTDTTVTDNVDYYYMVRAFDGANESVDSNVAGPVRSTDQQPPVIDNLSPADRALDVPIDTNISFQVSDTGAGVDRAQLQTTVTANGQPVNIGTPRITGTPARYTVVYDPPQNFAYRDIVQVTVTAMDLAGQSATRQWQFTIAGPPTYSISGRIANAAGLGLANVRVTAADINNPANELSALTDATGNYLITGLINGTYTVQPLLRGNAFIPYTRQVTINNASQTGVDFAWEQGFDLSGRVARANGTGLSDVTITATGARGLVRTAMTDANGNWRIKDVPADTYTITPALPRFVFTPASREATVGPSQANLDFTGALQTFSVSGVIRDVNGQPVANVTVRATSASGTAQTTTNASGQYTLTNLRPDRWTITPQLAGYQFRPASQERDVDANLTDLNFTAVPELTLNLPGNQFTFLSLPMTLDNTSPANAFGAIPWWRYDPTINNYRSYANPGDDTLPITQVRPGRGFWVRPTTNMVLTLAGTPTTTTQPYNLTLLSGWNMVGNPYPADLPWANVGVAPGGPVANYAFIWRPGQGYVLISNAVGLGTENVIPQNYGMWMKARSFTTVTVSPPVGTAAVAERPQWSRSEGEFVLPIIAQAGGAMDTTARVGVIAQAQSQPEAYVIANPPVMQNSVDVYFTGANGEELACDIRGAAAPTLTFIFTVRTDLQNVPVTISLPDLSQVPRDKAVILTDLASGKRLWARTVSSYSYNSGSGGERPFRLEITPHLGGGLTATLSPATVASGRVSLAYTLSRAAQVELVIMNMAGRVIRTLEQDKAAQPGLNSASWDLRTNTGAKAPAGRYLIRLQARAEDGQLVTAVAPLLVP